MTQTKLLRILGLHINQRYSWDNHINHLVFSLSGRLKIIKCLSNPKLNCNTYTVVKSIILSKINFALPIDGNSMLRKIKTIVNSAIRFSLGAFRSTPIKNILFESNTVSIETQTKLLTAKLLKSLSYSSNTPILQLVKKCKISRKIPRIPSTIYRSIQICQNLGLPLDIIKSSSTHHQPWYLNTCTLNTTLHNYTKSNCSPEQYQLIFNELKNTLYDHEFIFTDGSKTDTSISFSITTEIWLLNLPFSPNIVQYILRNL